MKKARVAVVWDEVALTAPDNTSITKQQHKVDVTTTRYDLSARCGVLLAVRRCIDERATPSLLSSISSNCYPHIFLLYKQSLWKQNTFGWYYFFFNAVFIIKPLGYKTIVRVIWYHKLLIIFFQSVHKVKVCTSLAYSSEHVPPWVHAWELHPTLTRIQPVKHNWTVRCHGQPEELQNIATSGGIFAFA